MPTRSKTSHGGSPSRSSASSAWPPSGRASRPRFPPGRRGRRSTRAAAGRGGRQPVREPRVVRGRVPEDRDRATVLGDRLERSDRGLVGGSGVEAEVALLGERRVHQDEGQLPGARFSALRVPEPVRVRRPGAQARQRGPADARVVAQARLSQLGRQPGGVAAQVVVAQALDLAEGSRLLCDRAGLLSGAVRGVQRDLDPGRPCLLERLAQCRAVALRVAVLRSLLAGEEEAGRAAGALGGEQLRERIVGVAAAQGVQPRTSSTRAGAAASGAPPSRPAFAPRSAGRPRRAGRRRG